MRLFTNMTVGFLELFNQLSSCRFHMGFHFNYTPTFYTIVRVSVGRSIDVWSRSGRAVCNTTARPQQTGSQQACTAMFEGLTFGFATEFALYEAPHSTNVSSGKLTGIARSRSDVANYRGPPPRGGACTTECQTSV